MPQDEPLTLAEHDRRESRGAHQPHFPRQRSVSAAITLRGAANLIHADSSGSAFIITLGSNLARKGLNMVIVDSGGSAGTNNITIATEGSENINGSSTYVLNINREAISIGSDGTNYFIHGGYLE